MTGDPTATIATAKSFDTFKPLGPCLVTADEFGEPLDLRIRTASTTAAPGRPHQQLHTPDSGPDRLPIALPTRKPVMSSAPARRQAPALLEPFLSRATSSRSKSKVSVLRLTVSDDQELIMWIAAIALSALVALVFAGNGLARLLGHPKMIEASTHLGYSMRSFRIIGLLEVLGALGIPAGTAVRSAQCRRRDGLILLTIGGVTPTYARQIRFVSPRRARVRTSDRGSCSLQIRCCVTAGPNRRLRITIGRTPPTTVVGREHQHPYSRM